MADEKHQPARCPAPSSEEVAKMQLSLLSPTLTLQRLSGGGGRENGSCWRDRWENRTQRGNSLKTFHLTIFWAEIQDTKFGLWIRDVATHL